MTAVSSFRLVRRGRRRWPRPISIIPALVLALTGVLTASPANAGSDATLGNDQPSNDVYAVAAADLVVPIAQAALSSTLFQVAISNSNGLIVAATELPPPSVQNQIQQAAGQVPVTFTLVANSERKLETIADQILADQGFWQAAGVEMSSIGPEWVNNRDVVTLVNYSPSAAVAIQAKYGTELVSVSATDTPLAQRADRSEDTAPWYGGDGIYDATSRALCTGGFNILGPNSTSFLLTAGHCGHSGDSIRVSGSSGRSIGKTTQYNFTLNTPYDFMLVLAGGGTLGYVWNSQTTVLPVHFVGTSDPVNGTVCVDGSFTGQVCSVSISNSCKDIKFPDGWTKCLVVAQRGAINVARDGDSGGPVYTIDSDHGLYARGEIIGVANANQTVYYTPMHTIMSKLGSGYHVQAYNQ